MRTALEYVIGFTITFAVTFFVLEWALRVSEEEECWRLTRQHEMGYISKLPEDC